MSKSFQHAAISVVLGAALAVCAWLAWWLASLALGAEAWDQAPALGLALGVGAIAAATGATVATLLNRSAATKMEPAERLDVSTFASEPALRASSNEPERVQKKKPLDKNPLRARVTPAMRWHGMSTELESLLRGSHVGKPIYQILHPEDVPAVDQAFTNARSGRDVQRVLCRLLIAEQPTPVLKPGKKTLRSDTKILPPLTPGSFAYVRIDVVGKHNRRGVLIGFTCQFIDMTSVVLQKEMELQIARKLLRRAKKRLRNVGRDMDRLKLSYRELYQQAPVMYFSLDRDGRFVTFNDTFLAMLGYRRDELQNKDYKLILTPEVLTSYLAISESMPSQAGELETIWRRKDGTQFDVWLHTVPVYDEAGNFVRCRNAALDLSEKNRLANELRARGDELERTNQSLRTINNELEAFTHVVSHDLKEPLRTLQAYSHLLAEEHAAELGPDGFQYVNHLIRASRRLGTLIDELLNLSQAGRSTHAPKAFNLNQIVATVRQDLVDLIQRKEAMILTEGSLPDVVGDPARITQLVTNLVANGLKYNNSAAPKVVVGAAQHHEDPTRAVVYIRDNGIGIDPAFHQQIFGIFRRLHQNEEFEGTGAGLAICKKIVEAHGGNIWVESQLGVGATFYFTLPRSPFVATPVPTPKEEAEQPSSRRQTSNAAKEEVTPRTIVLVEDQSDVGMIIQKLGKRDGIEVTWFPTAEEAFAYLHEHGADLLLFDVNLPGISGIELCRRVRALPHLQETPVALFTPDQDAHKLQALREAGAEFFLTKDLLCEPTVWQQRIRELLEQIRAATAH
jgi:PAS domain S-box-containing protein